MLYSGLSTAAAEQKFAAYGPNEIPEKKGGTITKVIKWFLSPIALMLLAAAFLSLFSGKTFDFWFILFLVALNFAVGFFQERKADHAIQELKNSLAMEVKTLRDGTWRSINARLLVPGDLIELGVGDVVPADAQLVDAENCSLNESTLTGESLPKEKRKGDKVFSGSFIATGIAHAEITATGARTYFGKTIMLVERSSRRSILEKDILTITRFLMTASIAGVLLLTAVFFFEHVPFQDLLLLDLSLVIAGIPISLPTVMTLIISVGALELARKQAIVRRLSALEDLANVNLLLTDKTGTLTQNKITVEKILAYSGASPEEVIRFASFASHKDSKSPIEQAILAEAEALHARVDFSVSRFIPADSERKRSSAFVEWGTEKTLVSVGAPQVIQQLSSLDPGVKSQIDADIARAADGGYRAIGVAVAQNKIEERGMRFIGLLFLSDPLREEAKDVILFLEKNGIGVKMLTGDNNAISKRISEDLGLKGEVLGEQHADWNFISKPRFDGISAFSQILPGDKHEIVKLAEHNGYIVAVTGDGVNDLPAVKEAHVGIAVQNAVDALKSAADIVLLGKGITVIQDALIEARKIFARLYSYSIYRISESFRLIVTVVILGIFYKTYPLTPIQLILIALLNDIPIISLAFNRVKAASRPNTLQVRERFILSSLYGLVGITNSIFLFILAFNVFHLDWGTIQTMYFLKLTVSGHLLIYVAHTKERWYKFFPSKQVIIATTLTQLVASGFAFFGFLMSPIPLSFIALVWLWSFAWMQVTEGMKILHRKIAHRNKVLA